MMRSGVSSPRANGMIMPKAQMRVKIPTRAHLMSFGKRNGRIMVLLIGIKFVTPSMMKLRPPKKRILLMSDDDPTLTVSETPLDSMYINP